MQDYETEFTPVQTSLVPGTMPSLQNRKAFENVLADYKIGDDAAKALRETTFVLMVSVTAAGRNTIIEKLLETGRYHSVVSDTTRPMRIKDGKVVEQHGVQYFFRPEMDILADLQAGKFIEAAIIHNQQVSGVSVREVMRANKTAKIAITDIEVQGCENVLKAKPDALPIFVLPPDFGEWMRRLNARSQLPKQEIRNRLETALVEFNIALSDGRFIFVINDDLERAVKVVDKLSHGGATSPEANERGRMLAKSLSEKTAKFLATL